MTPHADPSLARFDPGLAVQVLESATDFAIVTMDGQGVVTGWNRGAEALMGWTAAEMLGRDGGVIFTPADREAGVPADEMRRAAAEGRSTNERWHQRKDGTRFWGSGLLMTLKDGPDGGRGFLKIMRDRTAEVEADRQFQALTDALPGFVFVADADGHFAQVNPRFAEHTGRPAEELLGDRWLEAVEEEDRGEASERWRDAIAGGNEFRARLRFRSAAAEARSFDCRAMPQRDAEGRAFRWIGTCIDVEDEAQALRAVELLNRGLEHAVAERTAELEAEIAERARVQDALRQSQKMEAIGQLTGGVAHDFNNLLTVIVSSIGFLRREGLSPERRHRYVEAIAETADRAAQLTRQLLAFARKQALVPEVFDVAERLRGLSPMLGTVLGPRVEIAIEVACETCLVEADPLQFDTAIVNMAVNARDAMEGVGRFTIAVRTSESVPPVRGHVGVTGDFVAVSLADTGQGIAAEVQSRIFEPFFTTKEVGRGTGLGLSQVFGFAKQSHGEVEVESEPGQGAAFTLYLPQAEARTRPAEEDMAAPAEPERGEGCVLVVEDNRLVGEFAAQLLEDLGYGTVWVSSAKDALGQLEETPDRFAAVFTDVVMPGMNGIELAREIRRRRLGLPVVLTSGYSHVLAEDGAHGFELLHKPYSVEGLSRALRRVAAKG